jgi:hypothetical protein
MSTIDLGLIFRAQMYAIDSLLVEVKELLGQKQVESFGKEILGSIPTIRSLKDLPTVIAIAMRSDEIIDEYALSSPQLTILDREIERLGGKYLGKNRTRELLGAVRDRLPSTLSQNFQVWVTQQSE